MFSGSADYFLGNDDPENARDLDPITPGVIHSKVVPALSAALESDQGEVRAAAVKALGRIGQSVPVDQMSRLLEDSELHVRFSAAIALGDAEAKSQLERLTQVALDRKSDPLTRGFALISLGFIGDSTSIEVLKKVALGKEANLDLRSCALVSIGLIEGEETKELMKKVARDRRMIPNMRALAIDALSKQGVDDGTAEMLFELLWDKSPQVRRSAVIAVGQAHEGCPATGQALVDVYQLDRDVPVRAFACIAMGEQKSPKARGTLLKVFTRAPDAALKAFAAIGLGLLGDDTVAPHLIATLTSSSSNHNLRGACAVALGLLKAPKGGLALHQVFAREKNPSLRGYAALGLGMMGEKRLLPEFEKVLMRDSNVAIVEPVTLAIGLLGGKSSSGILLRALEGADNDELRAHLIHAIGHLKDYTFVDPFLAVMQNPKESEHSRVFAAIALGHLGDRFDKPRLTKMTNHRNYMIETDTIDVLMGML